MSQLLEGKTALILGVANRWSLAYAIARAFTRENANVILTYQGDRQKQTVEELAAEIKAAPGAALRCNPGRPICRLSQGLEGPGNRAQRRGA